MIFEKRELVDQPPVHILRKWAVDYGLDKFFYFFPNLRLEEIRTCPKTIAQPIIILWSRRLGDKSLFLSFSFDVSRRKGMSFSPFLFSIEKKINRKRQSVFFINVLFSIEREKRRKLSLVSRSFLIASHCRLMRNKLARIKNEETKGKKSL